MEDFKNTPDYDEPAESAMDRAVARRLAKLRTMPVDTTRLEKSLRAHLPHPAAKRLLMPRWIRPIRAVAASVVIFIITAAVLLNTSGGPVLASTLQMAQLHEEMVSGKMEAVRVSSIAEANRALLAQWQQSPALPAVPEDHVMACCMKSVKNKKVACVLLQDGNVPLTMTVANAADMQLPASPTMTNGGVTYHIQSVGKLNMVMTERDGRWICLTSELPAGRLMEFAGKLQF